MALRRLLFADDDVQQLIDRHVDDVLRPAVDGGMPVRFIGGRGRCDRLIYRSPSAYLSRVRNDGCP